MVLTGCTHCIARSLRDAAAARIQTQGDRQKDKGFLVRGWVRLVAIVSVWVHVILILRTRFIIVNDGRLKVSSFFFLGRRRKIDYHLGL
jgi:hypothetical protein